MPNFLEILLSQLMGNGQQPPQVGGPTGMGTAPTFPTTGTGGQTGPMGQPGQQPSMGQPPMGGGMGVPGMGGPMGGGPMNLMKLLPLLMAAKGGGQSMGAFANTRQEMDKQRQLQQQQTIENQQRQQQIAISGRHADIAGKQADLDEKRATSEIGLRDEETKDIRKKRAIQEVELASEDPNFDPSQLSPETQKELTPRQMKAIAAKRARMTAVEKLNEDLLRAQKDGALIDLDIKAHTRAVTRASSIVAGQIYRGEKPDWSKLPKAEQAVLSEEMYLGEYAKQQYEMETKKLTQSQIREGIATSISNRSRDEWINIGAGGARNIKTGETVSPAIDPIAAAKAQSQLLAADAALIKSAGQIAKTQAGSVKLLPAEVTPIVQQILTSWGRSDLAKALPSLGVQDNWFSDDVITMNGQPLTGGTTVPNSVGTPVDPNMEYDFVPGKGLVPRQR